MHISLKGGLVLMSLNYLGIKVPKILLPNEKIDLAKWAVVACDQYTSQMEYWCKVEENVGDAPSTLHLVFPEVYLEDEDKEERIESITSAMEKYMDEAILKPLSSGFIYVERETLHSGVRKGLMVAIDLEQYDYHEGSQTLIRATEGTVLDRLPPRICIRQGASLEIPHIMVLIDDPQLTVIEPITNDLSNRVKLYDFDLMMSGGHITGYQVDDKPTIDRIFDALTALANPDAFRKKYEVGGDKGVLLFAMGDGNHSLATAKACWEDLKSSLNPEEIETHPAHFALVELVNVHDNGLMFEPIHRVLFNVKPEKVLNDMKEFFLPTNQDFQYELFKTESEMMEKYGQLKESFKGHKIICTFEQQWGILLIDNPQSNLEVGTLQAFLDDYLKKESHTTVDYIHGNDVVANLGSRHGNIGFFLPTMSKNNLFKTVILDGVLPRKTFSMGEADEKRFYLECRKIIK